MYFILLISIVAGVLTISLRRHRVVRRLATGAAILFAVIAIFSDWCVLWSVTTLGLTAAAIAFLILVVIALVLPREHAKWIQTNGVPPPSELPSSTPGRFPTFYRPEALAAVHNGLRDSFERRGRSVADADVMFERLIANLRVLENLHMLIGRTSLGDATARTQLQESLQYLTQRFPAYRGSLKSLRDRVSKAPPTLNARGPCAIVTLPGMASIYTSTFTVGGLSSAEVESALDVLAGLSLGQSNLEVLSGSLTHDGPDGLDAMIDYGESTGSPYFTPSGRHRENFTDPSPDKMGGHPRELGPFVDLLPDEVHPLNPDACEMVREVCESMLVDAVTQGASFEPGVELTPALPGCSVSNIERLELATPQPAHPGKCAGDMLTIHGRNFGDAPDGQVVVLSVSGECARLNVSSWWSALRLDGNITIALPPEFTPYWSDTMIRFSIPPGITPGPVGIFDVNSIDVYNAWSSGVSRRVNEVEVSSKCLDTPLTGGHVAHPADTHIRTPLPPNYTPCPARTEHNVLEEVGAAVIRSFSASVGRGLDQNIMADPDDELTLEWSVINATSITITKLSLGGPDFNGNSEVVDPPGTSWSFGKLGHTDFGVYYYELKAMNGNNCGSVTAIVKVFASKRPDLGIDAVEITQGIQKVDNSVPLVENKPTVVRVFVHHKLNGFAGQTSVSPVRGRLRVIGDGGVAISGWLDPINSLTFVSGSALPAGSILLNASTSRATTNDTLNFRIPDDLCEGTIGVEAEVFVEGFGAIGGSSGFSERISARGHDFTFHRRRQLKIRFIPVELIPDLITS